MTGPPFVVAIDGPAASGKGTLARRLADRFDLAHLDTGKLYRAAAFLVLKAGGDPADPAAAEAAARRVDAELLSNPGLRGEAVAAAASIVGAIPAVRAALLAFQREFTARPPLVAGRRPRGAVLDGRDIGSVVCPEAAVKLFLIADAQTRAGRRVEELRASGAPAIYDIVLRDLEERDARDAGRREAPLSAAPGAVIIDTTALDAEAVFERASGFVAGALGFPS